MAKTRPNKIAFQGEPGANSHLACSDAYPDMEPLPCATFEDALAAVKRGAAELAMIPIENSVAGRVADIHHLLPDSELYIVGEHFCASGSNCLRSRAPSSQTQDGTQPPMALGQCRKVIKALKLKTVAEADTAGAARHLSEAEGS